MSDSAKVSLPTWPASEPWFVFEDAGNGVLRINEPAVHPFLRSNSWLVYGRDHDLLIDTGLGVASLRDALLPVTARQPWTYITHGHLDHMGGAHEFDVRITHRDEAAALTDPEQDALVTSQLPPEFVEALAADAPDGQPPDCLLSAKPNAEFDVYAYRVQAATPTRVVDDGDVIDLGDRQFHVLHLPGHTPGSSALFEPASGLLFSGDVLYDGALLDELPESSIDHYVASMKRLVEVPATRVNAGHEQSFDDARLRVLGGAYLSWRDESAMKDQGSVT